MPDRRSLVAALIALASAHGLPPASNRAPAKAQAQDSAPEWLAPDAFYEPPAGIGGERGALLGSEPLEGRTIPPGSRAWRIRYLSPQPDGALELAIATLIAPDPAPPEPLPLVAFAHGTVGVRQECLPSLMTTPFTGVPALEPALREGWALVAPDYVTGGRRGVHPYLIGRTEAASVLDAVRAARQVPGISLDGRTVAWGHSQGGQAVLWAGSEAPHTAPDVPLAGVAAIAPVTDMLRILASHAGTPRGAILGAYGALAYSAWYPDVRFDEIVSPGADEIARGLGDLCQVNPAHQQEIGDLVARLDGAPLLVDPSAGALGDRLRENTPSGVIPAPVLIAQGLEDVVVDPAITADFVAARCAAGQPITCWDVPGMGHSDIMLPGSPLEAPLIAWTRDRFLGAAARDGCACVPLPTAGG